METRRKYGRRARRRTDRYKEIKKKERDFKVISVVFQDLPMVTLSRFKAYCILRNVSMSQAIIHMMEQCVYENKHIGHVRLDRHRNKDLCRDIRVPVITKRLYVKFKAYCAERDVATLAAVHHLMEQAIKGKRPIYRSNSLQKRFNDAKKRREYVKENKRKQQEILQNKQQENKNK